MLNFEAERNRKFIFKKSRENRDRNKRIMVMKMTAEGTCVNVTAIPF